MWARNLWKKLLLGLLNQLRETVDDLHADLVATAFHFFTQNCLHGIDMGVDDFKLS